MQKADSRQKAEAKQKADARQSLVDAVRELLLSGGSFTVKDITNKAYTNVAAINYYFGDKNSLINLVLNELVAGYKKTIIDTLRQDYASSKACMESFLSVVGQLYLENKGVIRFIVNEETGNKSHYIEEILLDPELTGLVFEKMDQLNNGMSHTEQVCNYLICVSAFVLPLLLEVQNGMDEKLMSFSALKSQSYREVFVRQLMKLFA